VKSTVAFVHVRYELDAIAAVNAGEGFARVDHPDTDFGEHPLHGLDDRGRNGECLQSVEDGCRWRHVFPRAVVAQFDNLAICGHHGSHSEPLGKYYIRGRSTSFARNTYFIEALRTDSPFARGINSFQLYSDGTRWWIVTIFWDAETGNKPIPAKYLTR
jgi:hypothetical protein